MPEQLTLIRNPEVTLDPEIHDPALAAKFGRVIMEGLGAEAFTIPTLKEMAESEPFGVDLAEAREAAPHDTSETDEATVAALGETTYVLKMSTDWL